MNKFFKSLALNISFFMLVTAAGINSGWGQEKEVIAGGRLLYQKFCASCHGPRAMGDGPLSFSLQPKPANLTKLTANNGGAFPFWHAYRAIDGRDQIQGHNSHDMPVFGIWFRIPDDEVSIETEWADQVRGRIWQLLSYLESIQKQ